MHPNFLLNTKYFPVSLTADYATILTAVRTFNCSCPLFVSSAVCFTRIEQTGRYEIRKRGQSRAQIISTSRLNIRQSSFAK